MLSFSSFRIKENAGAIFTRVPDCARDAVLRNPQGDYRREVHLEGSEMHSRSPWRLPGLRHAVHAGIREGFVAEKTNLTTLETDRRHFITNRPSREWDSQSVLDRILLHRDTGTGVFGIKDTTFQEDRVRYKSLSGATASPCEPAQLRLELPLRPRFRRLLERRADELQDSILEGPPGIQPIWGGINSNGLPC